MSYSREGVTPIRPLSELRTYPLFTVSDPAWEIDLDDENVAGGRRRLHYSSVREMIDQADRTCQLYTGQSPPSQVGLFLSQFPDRSDEDPGLGYDDCTYALAALHADRKIGPGCCAAAIWIEPLEYPADVGAQIQRWATYHLTKHAWADGRSYAERVLRSRKVRWVSPEAREQLVAYVRRHHERAEEFLAQGALDHPPLVR